ncbi:MAG: rhodanese-like domain-containing protein [Flavobacteriales bacterium]|nr:rhodanese-like domain-containing protein [Flavobacteriales bacterium]
MKNNLLLTLVMFSISSLSAQVVNSKAYHVMLQALLSHSVTEVSVTELDSSSNILFVDARELKEYRVSHIKDAVFVGYDNLDLSPLDTVDKKTKIIVYCSVGYRSEKVSEKLLKKGFEDVSNLYGGIFEWKNQEKTVVNSKNEPTEKVHAFSKIWGIWLKKGKKVY